MKGLDGVLVQSHSSLISFSSSTDIHFSISRRDPCVSRFVSFALSFCFIHWHLLFCLYLSRIMRGIFLVLLLVLLGVTFTSTGLNSISLAFLFVWYSFLVCFIRNRWSHLESHQILFQWLENQRVQGHLFKRRPQHLHVGRLGHSRVLRH
jgi:hypothetical protein